MVNLEMGDMPENGVNQEEVAVNDKLKYVNGSTEDVKNEVESVPGKNFAGLTKAELLQYADDPFWVKLRSALLLLFWVVWFGMLGSAIIIIVLSPKCPVRPETNFLDGAAVYEVDSSFNGAELKAIAAKFGYIKETVKSKVIVVDDQLVKDMEKLKEFVREAHKNELKVMISVKAASNITQNLKKMMAVKVDGFKLTASNNVSSPYITSMLTDKVKAFGKYQDTVFVAEKALGLQIDLVDMVIDELDIYENVTREFQAFNINFEQLNSNVGNKKAFIMSALSRKGTPFIKAGNELGLDSMNWEELEMQQALGQGMTVIDVFSQVNALREKESMMFGGLKLNEDSNSKVSSFTRVAEGFPAFYIAINLDNSDQLVNFGRNDISGVVVANTENRGELSVKSKVTFGNIFLKKGQGIIIKCTKE